MSGILSAARAVQEALEESGLAFCFIGGVALQRWGEPRFTQNVDVQVACDFGDERRIAALLAERIEPREADAEAFALRSRVYLGRTKDGVPIDVAFAGIPFEKRVLERSIEAAVAPGIVLRLCAAEDLVVLKAFADRDRDWADIAMIVARRGPRLDWALIESELLPLLALRDLAALPERLVRLRDSG